MSSCHLLGLCLRLLIVKDQAIVEEINEEFKQDSKDPARNLAR